MENDDGGGGRLPGCMGALRGIGLKEKLKGIGRGTAKERFGKTVGIK